MTTRICSYCGMAKHYDPLAKPKSKASGFVWRKCWDCHLKASALTSLAWNRKQPKQPKPRKWAEWKPGMTRHCIYCGLDKPFDPTQKPRSLATGFQGNRCLACHHENNRLASAAHVAIPENRKKANAANAAWQKANREKMQEHQRRRRKPVLWADPQAIKELERQRDQTPGAELNHIVPIHGIDPTDGRKVSGLHVEYNLNVIPIRANNGVTKQHVDLALEAQRVTDHFWKDRFERSMFGPKYQGAWVHM